MTKDEMALVPVGKRQKKVQGKRQGVSARIRTLDGPSIGLQEETAAWGGPSVVARVLAVGKKANFVRGIIAGVLLTGLFLAAVVFIIFPKLQSPGEPLISGESAQTPLAGGLAAPTGSVSQASGPPPSGSAVPGSAGLTTSTQEPNSLMPENSVLGKSTDAVPPMNASRPEVVPVKIERFHVVISAFATKGEALQHLDKLSQQHPDLFLQITTARTGTGERRYLVVVGGSLSRDQADQLRQRVQKKGLQGAQVVPSADNR
jgi:cell division septation protein DedD